MAALDSTQEAVDIDRKLSASGQAASRIGLVKSLANLGNWQNKLGRNEDALASSQEALDTIWPFFLWQPAAVEGDVELILRNVRFVLETLDRSPSREFLQRMKIFEEER
jgi:hypothetical protein